MIPVLPNTKSRSEILILHAYVGSQGSSFDFYEDDGTTFAYQQGEYARRKFELRVEERKIIMHATQGTYVSSYKIIRIVFHGLFNELQEARINNTAAVAAREINQFFGPLEKFDPIYDPEPAPFEEVYTLQFDYSPAQIVVDW